VNGKPRWRDRSTGDVLVLMIASTICLGVAGTAAATIVFAFLNPGADVSAPARFIVDVVNTLIGLLAGFLAGRTETAMRKVRDQEDRDAQPDNE
jgi:hypothetical protein